MQERTLVMRLEPLNQVCNMAAVFARLTPSEPLAKLVLFEKEYVLIAQARLGLNWSMRALNLLVFSIRFLFRIIKIRAERIWNEQRSIVKLWIVDQAHGWRNERVRLQLKGDFACWIVWVHWQAHFGRRSVQGLRAVQWYNQMIRGVQAVVYDGRCRRQIDLHILQANNALWQVFGTMQAAVYAWII